MNYRFRRFSRLLHQLSHDAMTMLKPKLHLRVPTLLHVSFGLTLSCTDRTVAT